MKKLIILLILLFTLTANAQEVITDFDDIGKVILNQELRKNDEKVQSSADRITVLENAVTDVSLTADVTGILPLANGGTGANLADPNDDRILFWDDSGTVVNFLTVGTNLTLTGTTLSADEQTSGEYTASDIIIHSADTLKAGTTAQASPQKLKEIQIGTGGALRIKFSITFGEGTNPIDSGYNPLCKGQIYRNGTAVGTLQSASYNASYTTFSEDISGWSKDDLIQLYAYFTGNGINRNIIVKNFRIYGSGFNALTTLD